MRFLIFAKIVMFLSRRRLELRRFPPVMKVYKFLYQSLLPEKSVILVPVQEHKLYVDIGDMGGMTSDLVSTGIYEKQTTRVLRNIVTKGMVCLDIGANIGYFTLIAARLVGEEGKVVAFEPEPHNFDLLVRNITLNGYDNVIPVQKAISNKNGRAKLFLNIFDLGSHTLARPRRNDKSFSQDTIEIEVQTLDSFFKDYTGKIDLVKIDVEGAELAVLEGMENIINQNKDLIIITEFSPDCLSRFDSAPEEYLNRLVNYGFRLYDMSEEKEPGALTDVASLLKQYTGKKFTNLLARR